MSITKEAFIENLFSNTDCDLGVDPEYQEDFRKWFTERCEIFESNSLEVIEFKNKTFRKDPGKCYQNAKMNYFTNRKYLYYEGLVCDRTTNHYSNHAFNVKVIDGQSKLKDFSYYEIQEEDVSLTQITYCGVRIKKEILDLYLQFRYINKASLLINESKQLILASYLKDERPNDVKYAI